MGNPVYHGFGVYEWERGGVRVWKREGYIRQNGGVGVLCGQKKIDSDPLTVPSE